MAAFNTLRFLLGALRYSGSAALDVVVPNGETSRSESRFTRTHILMQCIRSFMLSLQCDIFLLQHDLERPLSLSSHGRHDVISLRLARCIQDRYQSISCDCFAKRNFGVNHQHYHSINGHGLSFCYEIHSNRFSNDILSLTIVTFMVQDISSLSTKAPTRIDEILELGSHLIYRKPFHVPVSQHAAIIDCALIISNNSTPKS